MEKSKFKVGDIIHYMSYADEIMMKGEIISIFQGRYSINWDCDKTITTWNFGAVDNNSVLANYMKSPLWKKLEGIK